MEKEMLQQVENKLPYGAKTEIARKAGVSIFTVMRFFKAETRNKKVLMATSEYLKEVGNSTIELSQVAATA